MKLQLDSFGQYKIWLYTFQAVVIFLAWALTIAVFTREGENDGRVGWYLGLCFLTIPILIYLGMVPMWSRARRFSNVYAFATLDMLSAFLWLTAWASVASYVAQGKSEGKDEGNADNVEQKSGCDNFKYGSPGRCQLATGTTILGVFIMLGFVATSFISFRAVMEYKRTGTLPDQGFTAGVGSDQKYDFQAQTQGDFDANMHNDDLDDAQAAGRPNRDRGRYDERYAPIYQHDQSDLRPQEPLSPLGPQPTAPYSAASYGASQPLQNQSTGYGGAAGYR